MAFVNGGDCKYIANTDEILFHELSHAYRHEIGLNPALGIDPTLLTEAQRNNEEAVTILMQNQYSGMNRTDHWGIQFERNSIKGNLLKWWYSDEMCSCEK